jgi:uncharacterized protein YeeX (DUF496 family)
VGQSQIRQSLEDNDHAIHQLKDIIKVKESMLEDQNNTIKNLKSNLENKVDEFNFRVGNISIFRNNMKI